MSFKVFWTLSAKSDLRKIQGSVSNDKFTEIIQSPLSVVFLEQFQFDEYRKDCRRIIVGKYKLLYHFRDNEIIVERVLHTLQNPNKSLM